MAEIPRADERPLNPQVRHEPRDVSARGVVLFGVGLVVSGMIIHIALWWLFDALAAGDKDKRSASPLAESQRRPPPPPPRLEGFEEGEWHKTRRPRVAGSSVELEYEWVDREKGIVRIPVEDAMAILAKNPKLLPVRPREEAEKSQDSQDRPPGPASSGRPSPGGKP